MRKIVKFIDEALRALSALDRKMMILVDDRACALATDPFPPGMKPLKGRCGHFRIRQGDYRIVYLVDTEADVVTIETIGHRSAVYDR